MLAQRLAAVLAAIDDHHAGVGSAIKNAVARIAGLLAIAVIPAAAGLTGTGHGLDLAHGFDRAMYIAAGLAAFGGLVAWLTIRRAVPVRVVTRASVTIPCEDPCLAQAS